MPPRKLCFFINTLPWSHEIVADSRRLEQLQQAYCEIVPPQFSHQSHAGLMRNGIIKIYARNAAIAAKLRQISPRLVLSFRERGFEVTAIHIEVQVTGVPSAPPRRAPRPLEPAAVESLKALAKNLGPSPLKSAVESLLARNRKRSRVSEDPEG